MVFVGWEVERYSLGEGGVHYKVVESISHIFHRGGLHHIFLFHR